MKWRAERQFKEYLVSNGMLDRWNNKPLQTEDTARRHTLSLAWARRRSVLRWWPVRMMVPFRDPENWVWEHTCGEICHPALICIYSAFYVHWECRTEETHVRHTSTLAMADTTRNSSKEREEKRGQGWDRAPTLTLPLLVLLWGTVYSGLLVLSVFIYLGNT